MAETVTVVDLTTRWGSEVHFDTTGDVNAPIISFENTTGAKLNVEMMEIFCGTQGLIQFKDGSAGSTFFSIPESTALFKHALFNPPAGRDLILSDGTSLAIVAGDGHISGNIRYTKS